MKKVLNRRWIVLCLSAIMVAMLVLPPVVSAQVNPDVEGNYIFRLPTRVKDLNNTTYTVSYRWVVVAIEDQLSEVIEGTLYFLARPNVKGSRAHSGTATIDARRGRQTLNFADNEVVCLDTGTITVRLPAGCYGYAYDGVDGEMEGGSVTLEAGDNEITITKAGDISVDVYIEYEAGGTFAGIVGQGTRAQIMLAGTTPYNELWDDGTAVMSGNHKQDGADFWRIFPPGEWFTVSGAGTFSVYCHPGNFGTVTGSGGLEIGGETVQTLEDGWNYFTTGVTTGTLHVNTGTNNRFMVNGNVRMNRAGEVVGFSGAFYGSVVLNRSPWNMIAIASRARASLTDWEEVMF
jgi:hypothetical protein